MNSLEEKYDMMVDTADLIPAGNHSSREVVPCDAKLVLNKMLSNGPGTKITSQHVFKATHLQLGRISRC